MLIDEEQFHCARHVNSNILHAWMRAPTFTARTSSARAGIASDNAGNEFLWPID